MKTQNQIPTTNPRAAWEEHGVFLSRGLFSTEEVSRFRQHYLDWNERVRKEDGGIADPTPSDPLHQFPRLMHPHRTDDLSLSFLLDKRLESLMRDLTGEEPVAAQTMVYFKPPGARGQALHQDQYYIRANPGTCIAAWLALDRCDADNGCLQVVLGSHKFPILCAVQADTRTSFTDVTVPLPPDAKVIDAVMEPGDALFFHGNLIHGSPPNRTKDRFRIALIAHYITGCSEEVARFYQPLLRFDGTSAEFATAPLGGMCGEFVESGINMVDKLGEPPSKPH